MADRTLVTTLQVTGNVTNDPRVATIIQGDLSNRAALSTAVDYLSNPAMVLVSATVGYLAPGGYQILITMATYLVLQGLLTYGVNHLR